MSGSGFIKYDFPFGQIQQLSNCVIDGCTELLAVLLGSIQIDLHVSAEKHVLIPARLIRRLLSLLLLPWHYLEDMCFKAHFRPLSLKLPCFCKSFDEEPFTLHRRPSIKIKSSHKNWNESETPSTKSKTVVRSEKRRARTLVELVLFWRLWISWGVEDKIKCRWECAVVKVSEL